MNRKLAWLPLVAIFLLSCSQKPARPKLVVFMVVDHMRPDLLTRFDDLYTGGFRWLMDRGLWFTNAHHEHGYTATGPGHFTLASGQYPGPVGMIGNQWYDRKLKRKVYCVEDTLAQVVGYSGEARSYRTIGTTALGDWVKQAYPGSKVYSIGGKDRSAVLMGGKQADLALYYNYSGQYVTSDYYTSHNPKWLEEFNAGLHTETYRDSFWTRSLNPEIYATYARRDNFPGENDSYHKNPYSPVFPIGFDSTADVKNSIGGTPWWDQFDLELAETVVENEQLGSDGQPDILFIAFSAIDWIIHDFGPHSQEAMDALIKLDRNLGDFIQYVDNEVGLEHVQWVLMSDHGGMLLPEYLEERDKVKAGRIPWSAVQAALDQTRDELKRRFGSSDFLAREGIGLYYDLEMLDELQIDPESVTEILREHVEQVEGIYRVFSKTEILNADPGDKTLRRLRNFFHPVKSPDAYILEELNYTFRYPYGTSHGSPYDHDTHVPILFARQGQTASMIDRKIETVDVAPTVAKLLGVEFPERVDGKVLPEVLGGH